MVVVSCCGHGDNTKRMVKCVCEEGMVANSVWAYKRLEGVVQYYNSYRVKSQFDKE